MDRVMIICRSQTEAFFCKKLLSGAGVTGLVKKPARKKGISSCVWGVSIRREDLRVTLDRLNQKNFRPLRIDYGE